MNRAAGDFDAVGPCLVLGIEAREGRQQRGVNVQNAIAELVDEMAAEQAHISGKAYKINSVLAQEIHHPPVVIVTVHALRFQRSAGEAEFAGAGEPRRAGAIRKNEANFAVELSAEDVTGDGLEVRTAAGEKDAKSPFQRGPRRRARNVESLKPRSIATFRNLHVGQALGLRRAPRPAP